MIAIEPDQDTGGKDVGRNRDDMLIASEPLLDALPGRYRSIQRRETATYPPGKRGQQLTRRPLSGNDLLCLAGFGLARLTVRIERNHLRHALLSEWAFPGVPEMLPPSVRQWCDNRMTAGTRMMAAEFLMCVMDMRSSDKPFCEFVEHCPTTTVTALTLLTIN